MISFETPHVNGSAGSHDSEAPPSTEAPRHRGLSPLDIISRWREQGPIERLATGWETFDRASRGGFIYGHCTFIVGAPNAKKTGGEACLSWRWAHEEIPVGALLVDETPEDFLIRFAVMAGFSLDDCERREPHVLAAIEDAIKGLPLRLYGAEETIESAGADFARFVKESGCRRAAFMVDTVQTVMSAAALKADNPRAIVNANVKALQTLAMSNRWAVLATSEMNRNAYRSEESAERSNDMAAAKESGAIEYAAKAQMSWRSVKGRAELVKVTAPKIKRGTSDETEFYLHFDRERHTLTECSAPTSTSEENDRDEAGRAKAARQVKADANTLRTVVLRNPGIGEVDLRAELRRHGHTWGVARLTAAKRQLGGGLENRGKHSRDVAWFVVAAPPESEEER